MTKYKKRGLEFKELEVSHLYTKLDDVCDDLDSLKKSNRNQWIIKILIVVAGLTLTYSGVNNIEEIKAMLSFIELMG